MNLIPIPAFTDNYIWMLHDGQRAVVVDPGDSQVVLDLLAREHLTLDTIVVTHHHADHTGGVDVLRETTHAKVFGPATETMPEPIRRLSGGESVQLLGHRFEVIDVPGHTAGHIAFYCADLDGLPLLFCGDTLFSGGCGRLFEGTPAQMLASLDALSALPGNTRVCCTHEYTLSNLRFARVVEPGNADLAAYEQRCIALRAQGLFTLPSNMAQEQAINPFLRSRHHAVQHSVRQFQPNVEDQEVAIFAALREWKNQF